MKVNSQEALEKIRAGVAWFQSEVYPSQRQMFKSLAHGQEPIALFITCADSRIVPNLITHTEPGELFVERNPGNLVPRHEDFVGGVSASVEYAMLALRVPVVIICGHTDCSVMKGLLHPETVEQLPAVRQWMRHATRVRKQSLPGVGEEQELLLITRRNVLLQMENLKTHPSVRRRLDAGTLEIRGWVYDIATGAGWGVNPAIGKFEPWARNDEL